MHYVFIINCNLSLKCMLRFVCHVFTLHNTFQRCINEKISIIISSLTIMNEIIQCITRDN